MPTALITGITGQDGRFLADLLHSKGYTIYGLINGQNNPKTELIKTEYPYVELIQGDLTDLTCLIAAVVDHAARRGLQPRRRSRFVALSFNQAELTANITGTGVLRMLEAIRIVGGTDNNPIRFYQASVVGDVRQGPRDAADRAHAVPPAFAVRLRQGLRARHHGQLPRELRHVRVLAASCSTTRARGAASSSSPARSPTRWPASSSACRTSIVLGNLDSKRDWGYAGDYVKAMWLMLQQDEPDDYVVATGETYEHRRLRATGLRRGRHRRLAALRPPGPEVLPPGRGRPAHRRPVEGAQQARLDPEVSFPELVKMMVAHDLEVESRTDRYAGDRH